MKRKIFFFKFVYLLLLRLLVRICNLINLELKFLNNYFSLTSYKLLKSNHPSRFKIYFDNIKNLNLFQKNFDWSKNNRKKNKQYHLLKNDLKNNNIIFFGDSHVEFLSRVIKSKIEIVPNNHFAYWIGPKTVVGLLSKVNFESIYKNLIKVLFQEKKKIYLVMSFGGIDVRCIFYELLFRNIVKNEKELFELFDSGLDILFNNILKKLRKNNKLIGIGILALVNSSLKGKEPNTVKKLINEKSKELFPTFGSKLKRLRWTKKANYLLKKKAKKYKVDFIGEKSLLNIKNTNNLLNDGIHLSSKNIINKLNLEIIENAKKNKFK